MIEIGEHDDFEANYIADLKARVIRRGVLIEYPRDRVAIDLGLHLKRTVGGKIVPTNVRVWMQAKGLHSQTFSAQAWDLATSVPVSNLKMDHVKFWYASPEPVYLVVYIESVDTFLAADVRGLIDDLGGWQYFADRDSQATTTMHLLKTATLEEALDRMPTHRSMRIDGPAFRGRPLGHNFDPLRSELNMLPVDEYIELVDGLLKAHEFRPESQETLANGVLAKVGKLYLTYEWVLPMTTEFGFGPDSDFVSKGSIFMLRAMF